MKRFTLTALGLLSAFLLLQLVALATTDKPAPANKSGEIRGVLDWCAPRGASGVVAHLPGHSFQAILGPSGSFALHYVPVGSYALMLDFSGLPSHSIQPVSVSENQVTDLGVISICRDSDSDTFSETDDCNDTNPRIHPGAVEVCDGVDNNCDGQVDESCLVCTDADFDGFFAQEGCGTLVDCDDFTRPINPAAAELCDGIDNDCDGSVDEDFGVDTDPNQCGSCLNVCSNNHIVTPTCSGGICDGACDPGWADCDSDKLTTGCETDVSSDFYNCGSCGNVCVIASNFSEVCREGLCEGACESGWADCNDSLSDGCETELLFTGGVCP